MRFLRALFALAFLAAGVTLGVLNAGSVAVDLGVVRLHAGLGVILLCTLLAGVLLGGLAIVVSVVLPLRRARRMASSSVASPPATSSLSPTTEP
jgi:uncharacterized integral membrane protein